MSGFLDRMGARASGAAAEVAPRAPAVFESAALSTGPVGAPGSEWASVPVRLGSVRPGPSVSPSSSFRREPSFASARDSALVGPPFAVAALASAEDRPPVPAAQPVDSDRPPATVGAEPARMSESIELRSLLTPSPQESQSLPPVVPAIPVLLAAAALPGGMPESSVAAQHGPDVIRISIGRVDVRAPAPQPRPAAPPVPVPPAKADRLTLQDYLSGQRGTQ